MKQSHQIDCQLNCKATAEVTLDAINDLEKPDRPLASLINDERSEDDDDETKNISNPST